MSDILAEINAVGISCRRIRDGVPDVPEDQQELASLVVAAADKQDGDPEIDALKNALGAESEEWAAYVETRKAPIREQRQARYKNETDPMYLKIDEDHTPLSVEWEGALQDWRNAKNQIREDLPYPVSL